MIQSAGGAPEAVVGRKGMLPLYPHGVTRHGCKLHLATSLATQQLFLDHTGDHGNVGLQHVVYKKNTSEKEPKGI